MFQPGCGTGTAGRDDRFDVAVGPRNFPRLAGKALPRRPPPRRCRTQGDEPRGHGRRSRHDAIRVVGADWVGGDRGNESCDDSSCVACKKRAARRSTAGPAGPDYGLFPSAWDLLGEGERAKIKSPYRLRPDAFTRWQQMARSSGHAVPFLGPTCRLQPLADAATDHRDCIGRRDSRAPVCSSTRYSAIRRPGQASIKLAAPARPMGSATQLRGARHWARALRGCLWARLASGVRGERGDEGGKRRDEQGSIAVPARLCRPSPLSFWI